MMRRRHGCFRHFGIALLVGCWMPAIAQAGAIRILPKAEILKSRITVGDVAVLRDFDPELTREMRAVVLAEISRAGSGRVVHAREISHLLEAAGANLADVRIYGSLRCEVTRLKVQQVGDSVAARSAKQPAAMRTTHHQHTHRATGNTHSHRASNRTPVSRQSHSHSCSHGHQHARGGYESANGIPQRNHRVQPPTDSLEAAVQLFIQARMPDLDGEIDVALNRRIDLLREVAESGAGRPSFQVHERDPIRLGLVGLEVDIYQGGQRVKTLPVVAQVELLRPVLVARRPINRGQTVSQRDLRVEKRRFDSLEGIGLSEMELAVGYEATRFIPEGDMLSVRALKEPPLIRRGATVKILISGGGVQITALGKAQKEGALGDVIPVAKNGSHRKRDIIDAMVTGPGVVTFGRPDLVAQR